MKRIWRAQVEEVQVELFGDVGRFSVGLTFLNGAVGNVSVHNAETLRTLARILDGAAELLEQCQKAVKV